MYSLFGILQNAKVKASRGKHRVSGSVVGKTTRPTASNYGRPWATPHDRPQIVMGTSDQTVKRPCARSKKMPDQTVRHQSWAQQMIGPVQADA
eukprot:2559164-Pyramimonas_sp.AAC.1